MIKLNKLINLANKITYGQHGQVGQHRKSAKIFWATRRLASSTRQFQSGDAESPAVHVTRTGVCGGD